MNDEQLTLNSIKDLWTQNISYLDKKQFCYLEPQEKEYIIRTINYKREKYSQRNVKMIRKNEQRAKEWNINSII